MTKQEAIIILMGYNHTPQERAALEVLIPELTESEDERIRKEIIEFVDTTTLSTDERHHRWIAYLEKQKEPKPAEWSEEDEKMIQSLSLEIDKYVFFAGIESKKIINFLKSLRPSSWKPSEELIGCLERVMAFKHPEPEDIKGCEELYEQLKKLKEGKR